jgi:peptide-methionine (S)-S-oxide reductase
MTMKRFLIALLLAAGGPAAAAPRTETAVLAGGCFWGMEWVFEHVKGVRSVVSGYAGGSAGDASYDKVSSERTGHAEAVKITYDPAQISYGKLLEIYFTVAHDPTEVNRQGPDTGPSYRSAIFPQTGAQEKFARAYIRHLNGAHVWKKPIATRLEHSGFYPAEA